MARLPRLVLPGYPYHVTQRGNRRSRPSSGCRLCALSRSAGRGGGAGRGGDLVLLPDAQPCPRHRRAVGRGWLAAHLRRRPSALHRLHQRRHRWTGHLWQGRFGAVAMDESISPMRCATFAQPGARAAGRARRGLSLVERRRASGRQGRRSGQRGAGAGSIWRFADFLGATGGLRRGWRALSTRRPPAGRSAATTGSPVRGEKRPNARPAEARTEADEQLSVFSKLAP